MDHPLDFEKLISSLKCSLLPVDLSSENAKDIHDVLTSLLTSENGVRYLKQHPMNLEVVLPLFIRIIFYSDRDIAQSSLKYRDVVLDLFRSSLPKIKKEGWWKQFETKTLLDLIDSLRVRVEGNDEAWVATWTFITNIVITEKLNISLFNKLLSVTEHAFKKGRDKSEIKDNAWLCWKGLIDAFGRSPQILVIHRAVNLLLKPLLSVSPASINQIDTWVHLLLVKGLSGPAEVVKSIVDPMLKSFFNAGEKSGSRKLPDACANALIKTLSHDHVVQHCLPEYIGVFEACVDSKPSAGLIEQLVGILVQSINNVTDDAASFKMWKVLVEHYNRYAETPILSQACLNIFTDINFHRWIDSSTVEAKEIAHLMDISEFRDKVLIESIKLLALDETNTKKKSKKGTWEEVWSNYCEAYVSWWSTQSPSKPKESEDSEALQSLKDSCDYQAVRFLLLHPLQLTIWNPTISKTWSILCEACHNRQFLHLFVKAIFDALGKGGKPNFQVQKAIIISDHLYKLDQNFCKHSAKVLESISNTIFNMEFQNLSDLLSLTETAALYPEMSPVLFKIFKNANERSSEFEHFDAHRIKTKVNKIMRKLEQLTNSAEKEKTPKTQRAPFRAQSSFLQRLAKAEGKNKTKSPFMTSMFSSSEKGKNCIETEELGQNDVDTMDRSDGNGVITDENKKPLDHLDDSEIVPMITLPSVLKSTLAKENSHTEGMVAEKENVILSTISGANTTSALTICSPKIKITNAREVKTVDATSPAAAKKLKPIAGQKLTPKKVTPSKVSYFDDDANDCVMVPPRPKTTPLTEHQMEMMSKRRTDIPALYQDLSQDTQSQQVAAIQELISGGPPPNQESQDIVPGTPLPEDRPTASTPERQKSSRNTLSAKKLDFNNLPSLPSTTSPVNDKSSNCDSQNSDCGDLQKIGTLSTNSEKCTEEAPVSNGSLSSAEEIQPLPLMEDVGVESKPTTEEKSKRKRKTEPAKFSPKLTRSKRSLKSTTPDAKSMKSNDSNSKEQLMAKSPDITAKMSKTKSPQRGSKNLDGKATDAKLSVELKSLDPLNKNIEADPVAVKIEESKSEAVKTDDGSTQNPDNGRCEQSSQPAECNLSILQAAPETPAELCQDEPKTVAGRKRKIVESSTDETPKKMKSSEEDCPVVLKNSAKKKKKPFKLGAGGNLESWLVKTDRSPGRPGLEGPPVESVSNCENEIKPADEAVSTSESSNRTGVDLDNSEEIVPSTQEYLVENKKPLLPVLETKIDEKCKNEEVVKIEEQPTAAIQDEVKTHSPEKPEGSVLEQLSQESPNDDDIPVFISPSKRQMRASSVFRNEGDSYVLKKEKASCVMSEQMQDDSKVSVRSKTKPTSPSCRNTMGGRSAKMLRLATSTTQEEGDDIVVTPVRRRGNIVPVKYGDNWPKGTVEDWVAFTPASPYMSPFRSALKRTPAADDNVTPQSGKNDSMASPLLSSAKRKRVVFFDPPVTRGLSYEVDSPGGSVFHADVPQGSPYYPVWKGEDERRRGLWDEDKMEISPSKRCVERLKSSANLNDDVFTGASSSKHGEETPELNKPLGVSDEVRQLIAPAEPTTTTHEPDMNQLQEKFMLSDAFMTTFAETDPHVRSLLVECFYCSNMAETVDAWKFGDCRRVCQMPHSFLLSVKNLQGDVLTEVLSSGVFAAPSSKIPAQFADSSVQTDRRENISTHSQTEATTTSSVATNTDIATASSSTQVEAQLKLPSVDDWPSISKAISLQSSLNFLSDSLRVLSSSLPNQ